MKIKSKGRLVKSILYRLSAMCLAQFLSWFIFRRVEINIIIASVDGMQTVWYYIYDWLWEKKTNENTK